MIEKPVKTGQSVYRLLLFLFSILNPKAYHILYHSPCFSYAWQNATVRSTVVNSSHQFFKKTLLAFYIFGKKPLAFNLLILIH